MPDLVPQQASQQRAAEYLRELLLRPGRHRRKWEQFSERGRPGQVNQLAVAEVLAHYLWDNPRTVADNDVLPRQLKDTASRALSGALLSRATLQLFMDAFDLPEFERDQLRKLWEGEGSVRFLRGPRALRPEQVAPITATFGPPGHRTVALHDHVYVGAGRLPERHRVLQVIEAVTDGLDRLPFIYDTSALTVSAGLGCTGVAGPVTALDGGLYGTYLLLSDRLRAGQTLTIEYWISYGYPEGYEGPDGREYRRAFLRGIHEYDIRVEFDAETLPAQVWWAVWGSMDGEIEDEREVPLDSQRAVQRYLSVAEKVVVGFHWEW
jgi:hypothetical protein